MEAPLLSIGMFSRASLLSIKALRAYHEMGILVPAHVDPRTGYRSYDVSQLAEAAILRRLRRLDLPLDEIRIVLDARDPDVTRSVLARHEAAMRARLDETERIVAELQAGVSDPHPHTPVYVRAIPGGDTLAVRGQAVESEFGVFLDAAYETLFAAVEQLGVEPSGPPGALYPAEIADDQPQPVEAYVPIASLAPTDARLAPRPPVLLGEVPATHAAVLVHAGPYDAISESYQRLGAWVARNARSSDERVREVYLVSFADAVTETGDVDMEQFRTEIQWPVLAPQPPPSG